MEFNIKLTEQEANIVLAGLSELPLKTSFDIAINFKNQCTEQVKANKDKTNNIINE